MIYLDNAALERPKQECIDAALDVWQNHWGNPSSIYQFGLDSRQIVECTRKLIAKEINCKPEEIIFTSGGSEANTLAINGYLKAHMQLVAHTTTIEHPSIIENPNTVSDIHVSDRGYVVEPDKYLPELYSIQFANSEIGTIQDIKGLANNIHKAGGILHVDAVQAFGHIPIDVKALDIDMMSATGQKIGSVPGCGFLYVKNGIQLFPIIYGHQERGLRAGTENVAAIASLGKAIELINYEKQKLISAKRNKLHDKLQEIYGDNISLNGANHECFRIPNNLSITFSKYSSEALITLLSEEEIYISAGSACNAGTGNPSYVLKAIGLTDKECARTIRVTLSEDTTDKEIDEFVKKLKDATDRLDAIYG